MKAFIDENDQPVEMALFDGYPVGDRLLEGVMFQCRIVNGRVSVTLPKGTPGHDYMTSSKISIPKWIKEIEAYVQDHDVFTHPDTGEDVYLDDTDIPFDANEAPLAKPVGSVDLSNIVKKLKP